jgi:hypothetical protein
MRPSRRLGLWVVAWLVLAPATRAGAQAKTSGADPGKAGGRSVLTPEELRVEGTVVKPRARPSRLPSPEEPAPRERRENFLPKVWEALEKEPF